MNLKVTTIRVNEDDYSFLQDEGFKISAEVRYFLESKANELRFLRAQREGLITTTNGKPVAASQADELATA